ncbi:uncharacterized protein RAG0_06496 [Rhynchosporium agropyri]|uniref:Uncharacterized protein n=1 Tax=Rhynchosporium agropyri TaxID=914238 RepID=A0A1E1KH62_9HELO|nr:uncharacterized protein RAG0_06496 [Rhynchosporium agropyri]
MIRLPATTIVLGRSDLLDYEKRLQTRGRDKERVIETDKLKERLARITVRSQPGSYDHDKNKVGQGQDQDEICHHEPCTGKQALDIPDEYDPESPSHESTNSFEDTLEEEDHATNNVGFERSPENLMHGTPRPVSISKHDFYYGGFVETSSPSFADYTPHTPNDASTPQILQIPSSSRFRSRTHLPRSPLYVSQNASTSPERRPTSGLTPRVASRVATHNTPGIIFSQPARRPSRITTRITTRAYRHQTNSFSFDSSERSSAAYEQERAVSSSTDGRAETTDRINLSEDLRGSSLHSSRTASSDSYRISATPDVVGEGESIVIDANEDDEEDNDWDKNIESSSVPFALPPPFSTVSRSASRANSLPHSPAREHFTSYPSTSPISFSTTSSRTLADARSPSRHSSQAIVEHHAIQAGSPSGSRFNPVTIVNRAISIYRTRSPFSRQASPQPTSPSPSPSPTPRQDQSRRASANIESTTPSRVYRVYNDAESPDLQPQTPANLPESRHQSRYHPSYTAPVTRAAARRGLSADINDLETLQQSMPRQRRVPAYTPLRGGRSASPVGLVQGGFQGLYGGRENGDEEQSWIEGVRFNNAGTRLWGSRDAQNDGGSLRRTPEPDDWRVGRRN